MQHLLDTALLAVALLTAALLLSRRVRDNRGWRAMATPPASIIGSGFLVIVPLLGHEVEAYAPLAMLVLVAVSYAVGAAIRYNIIHVEPLLAPGRAAPRGVQGLERASDLALALSYFISVTFYLRLLGSFVFRGLDVQSGLGEQAFTTALLAFVGLGGLWKGLAFLERLEEYSVSLKLSVIAALLVGWAVHDFALAGRVDVVLPPADRLDPWQLARFLAGALLVVQGFETSRYLGEEYDPPTRVGTMRWAQFVAGAIYLVFVALTITELAHLPATVDDTAIIDLSERVARILGPLLILAAVMSQFSAGVADTVGAGGLLHQTVGRRLGLPERAAYPVIAGVGIVLVWSANIFEIIALASRAFETDYALQCA